MPIMFSALSAIFKHGYNGSHLFLLLRLFLQVQLNSVNCQPAKQFKQANRMFSFFPNAIQ